MRLAVFGTETEDGLTFVQHALRVGFELQLLSTRTTALDKLRSSKIQIIQGDYNKDTVGRCLQSCDAVVVLINETVNDRCFDTILDTVEEQSVARLVVCDDMQGQDNYDDFSRLSLKLCGTSVDWTVIKRAHQDMPHAIKQIDASLIEELGRQKSFAAYVINQVTDSRLVGATVMLTS